MVKARRDRVAIRGCAVSLQRGGEGQCLLYLHGAAGAGAWLPFMDQLAASFDVVVPEHPGFGASDTPAWLDSIHDLAYFYLDLLEALDLRDVHLVGSSLGGWIALEIAVRNLSRLRTLTLSAAAGIHVDGVDKGDPFLWSPEETWRQLIYDEAVRKRFLEHQPSEAEADAQLKNRETVARLGWAPRMHDPDLRKWIHRVTLPVQVIWGEQDRLLPVAYAHAFGELIPQARVTVIPECGHLPHAEQPDLFARTIADFITGAGS